eukprot:scaffold11256_cov80-Skeletonema_dohrnii-CCMP3373.AAC.3
MAACTWLEWYKRFLGVGHALSNDGRRIDAVTQAVVSDEYVCSEWMAPTDSHHHESYEFK